MIQHRAKSKNWRTHRFGRASTHSGIKEMAKRGSNKRVTAGFEYIGD
jgi:hypothetical protein